ncbi:geranylgeranyl diphosphate synthase, type II [Arthrobacter alpinus]|uniref:Geranylgeranyl diphosphate synthase, type II n=2 Tax=Arthrobacter alpinus TaxID=656366 RepID=A0A1H5F5K1_9MICC|nr:geranylgeranyl diphosphate synthase, type II [Arthrobacter alpinus]
MTSTKQSHNPLHAETMSENNCGHATGRAYAPVNGCMVCEAVSDWGTLKDQVQATLDEYFQDQEQRARNYSAAFGDLWAKMALTTKGGKWMRPRLVYVTYSAFGGSDTRACGEMAAAFEVLHAALLVHDDVIDRDFIRRGAATIGAGYRDMAANLGRDLPDAEHAGFSASIIAGDLLLTGALRLATSASRGHPHSVTILETMHEAIFAAAAGELDDLLFSLGDGNAQLPEVLKMERLKTAVYSFEMPLRAGALLAGQTLETADALAAVGRDIGIAYQVIDDVLGTFGDAAETGKSIDSDLREGKRTILTTFAAEAEEFTAVLQSFRGGRVDADAIRDVLRQLGAEKFAVGLAQSLVSDALDRAQELALPASLYAELSDICEYVLTRRS